MGDADGKGDGEILQTLRSVVFKQSEVLDEQKFQKIQGYDFNHGVDFMGILGSMASTGFQASNLGDAIDVVNQMVSSLIRLKTVFFFFFCELNMCLDLHHFFCF